ncbi:histidinol dehydrogenase [Arthrobacter agilis]|uniref:histidinol dehydrogenase n=1 Tax=Arthrobacter agilis TaxID=37921 RepID=UPI000B35D461|nr:histidinol dehydrogenase [Arthrobacter agilis]OUM45402.1 histidinol dehydrogenase [Arthrobacter agilis]PPB46970.1 histidinol dehydrogenase [Arthrobacter agilis]TPV23435.1 histidinol dehydrogenase [Arthrobacter agilis]
MTSAPSTPSVVDFRTLDLRGRTLSPGDLKRLLPRAAVSAHSSEAAVQAIVDDVRARGLGALRELAHRFDGVEQDHPRVPADVIAAALEELDDDVRGALEEAIRRARLFAEAQRPADVEIEIAEGARLTHRWIAVDRVGLYVPGGLAVYPSSVVMNVVPAQAAGVRSIALASPPQKEFGGWPHPVILAAAAMLGVTEVHAMGGAQAVAALAYGVVADGGTGDGTGDGVGSGEPGALPGGSAADPSRPGAIDPVNLITGPGNVFVATAKRLVRGSVGIDSEAGTTEIAVLADAGADADLVAADLVSQAEHDPQAASVLVTDSEELAAAVVEALGVRAQRTRHADRVRTALSGPQSGVILVDDLEHGIAVCDAYAAEHLEIQTADAAGVARRIRNAGAVFVGAYSPVSLGDYCAGSNHVLPTGGTAAFTSGLNVTTFLKAVQLVQYDREALREVSASIEALSDAENLPAHGEAVAARFEATGRAVRTDG